jgi:hypothetical protein
MDGDRLPVRTLFGRFGEHPPPGRPPGTWIQYRRADLFHLSEWHGVYGTNMNWWLVCKDSLDKSYPQSECGSLQTKSYIE